MGRSIRSSQSVIFGDWPSSSGLARMSHDPSILASVPPAPASPIIPCSTVPANQEPASNLRRGQRWIRIDREPGTGGGLLPFPPHPHVIAGNLRTWVVAG